MSIRRRPHSRHGVWSAPEHEARRPRDEELAMAISLFQSITLDGVMQGYRDRRERNAAAPAVGFLHGGWV
jgi:hypothetical protein